MDSEYVTMAHDTRENQEETELTDQGNMVIEQQELMQYTQKHVTWTQIIGGSVGNILEWYDFAGIIIYNYFKYDATHHQKHTT